MPPVEGFAGSSFVASSRARLLPPDGDAIEDLLDRLGDGGGVLQQQGFEVSRDGGEGILEVCGAVGRGRGWLAGVEDRIAMVCEDARHGHEVEVGEEFLSDAALGPGMERRDFHDGLGDLVHLLDAPARSV